MAAVSIRFFYQTSKSRKFSEYHACFDSKRIAYSYIRDVAKKALDEKVKLHLYVESSFYQVDVDKAADGWVAIESSSRGIRRMEF